VNDLVPGYEQQTLEAVATAGVLQPEALEQLQALAPELTNTWEKQQRWRTETEARVSVLGDYQHPTLASKYWQAVCEQGVFTEQLVHLAFDYRVKSEERAILQAEEALLRVEAEQAGTSLVQRSLLTARANIKAIEAERALYLLREMQLAAKDRLRELAMWSNLKAEVVALAEKRGQPFDTTNPDTHQLATFAVKFERQAEVALKSNAGPAELRNALSLAETTKRVQAERAAALDLSST
jgi:hypothetical protein